MLKISPYNPAWPEMAQEEIAAIKKACGDTILNIHHMGSTSVPGLDAKPIIDMIAEMDSLEAFDYIKLEDMGYVNRGELIIPFRTVLHRGDPRSHFLHIFEKDDPQIERNLCFRDYLKTNPDKKNEYAQIKHELAAKFQGSKTFWGYTRFKAMLIEDCLKDAGFDKYILTRAYAPEEWAAFKELMLTHGVATEELAELSQKSLLNYERNYFILTQFGEVICGAIVEKDKNTYQVSANAKRAEVTADARSYFDVQIARWIRYASR